VERFDLLSDPQRSRSPARAAPLNALDRILLGAALHVPVYGQRLRGLIAAGEHAQRLERKLSEPVAPSPDEPTLAFAPPGHFYSPIPSPKEIERHAARLFDRSLKEIPGVDLALDDQLALVQEFAGYYAEQPFTAQPENGRRFGLRNGFFEYSDAFFLYGMMRKAKPKRIVEIGSGNSSACMLDVNELFFENRIDLTFIEPYADSLRSKFRPGDEERVTVVERPLETVAIDVFSSLQPNDILFVDCSHVVKAGSDAQYLFAEILPAVQPGVIVHVHDIFYPFEYPREWIAEGRYWNEAYVLRSFLQFNSAFRILAWVHLLWERFPEQLFAAMPQCRENCGGSFWMVRTR
jgi:predicted O-methyltransferase YrrM